MLSRIPGTHVATHQLLGWDFTLPLVLADAGGNVFENPLAQLNGQPAVAMSGYDAWNRLSTASTSSAEWRLVDYHYDALHRRIAETTLHSVEDENGVTSWTTSKVSYHSDRWQVLEEREAYNATISSSAKAQNVWSTVYVDALVARDDDADASAATSGRGLKADGTPSGGLERRAFAVNDANFNVTALVGDAAGPGGSDAVVERYPYDPYGGHEVLTAGWAVTWGGWGAGEAGSRGNPYRFQGPRFDAGTGLHHARFREYDWGPGRWLTQDPSAGPTGPTGGGLSELLSGDMRDKLSESPRLAHHVEVARAAVGGRPSCRRCAGGVPPPARRRRRASLLFSGLCSPGVRPACVHGLDLSPSRARRVHGRGLFGAP